MNRLSSSRTYRQRDGSARQGSVYIAVTGTAMLVTLIGLTSLHLSRLELRGAIAQNERAYARQLAHTGVEAALAQIDSHGTNWRTNLIHGVEVTVSPTGSREAITFRLLDNADSDLANDSTQPVEIQGIGRYGTSTTVYSASYAPATTLAEQVGPVVLRSYTTGGGSSSLASVSSSNWWGQYFLPSLPVEAVSWTITSVEVLVQSSGATTGTLDVSLSLPDGSLRPGTRLESVAVSESQLPSIQNWYGVSFSSVSGLDPGVGLCLALTSGGTTAANVKIETSGVSEPDAQLLSGDGSSWTTSEATQSLYYRVHGVYSTASAGSGAFTITPGSWQSRAAP